MIINLCFIDKENMQSTLSLILFFLFAIIAISNFYELIKHLKNKSQDTLTFIPLIGLILFILAMNSLDEPKPMLWLLLCLDLGTVFLCFILPSTLYQVFLQSRFCKHAVYLYNDQTIILYQFRQHQILQWQRSTSQNHVPMETGRLMAFNGDWYIEQNQFYILFNQEKIAIAQMQAQTLVFTHILHEDFDFLKNAIFIPQK